MRRYSVRIFNEEKGWPQRGVRVVCHTSEEAVALAKKRLHIPQERRVLARCKIVG